MNIQFNSSQYKYIQIVFIEEPRYVDLPLCGINRSEILVEVRKYPEVQIVTEYMGCGERLIESHCIWFHSKFLLGKLLYL